MKNVVDVASLISRIKATVPYIVATIDPDSGNTFEGSRPEWIEVHEGRARSSVNQLQALLQEAQEMEKKLVREEKLSVLLGGDDK